MKNLHFIQVTGIAVAHAFLGVEAAATIYSGLHHIHVLCIYSVYTVQHNYIPSYLHHSSTAPMPMLIKQFFDKDSIVHNNSQ